MIKIVVDSTADVPAAIREKYGITIVPVLVQFERESLRDDVDITRDDFYSRLVGSETLPKTAAPSVGMFEEVFRALTADGSKVLSISLAGDLSGTFAAARQAAQLVDPARIRCVDSRVVALPMTYMAIAAAQAAAAGHSLDELVRIVEGMCSRSVLYVGLDTLRYLEKGGRIGYVRAFLGTMLNVKPILEVREAQVRPVEQVRTWKRVPVRIAELAQGRGSFEELGVLYTTNRDVAVQLADLCGSIGLMPRDRILIEQVGAVLGTHVGPGAVGLAGILKA